MKGYSRLNIKSKVVESGFGDTYYDVNLYLRVKRKFWWFGYYTNILVEQVSIDLESNYTPDMVVEYLVNNFRVSQQNKRNQKKFIKELKKK